MNAPRTRVLACVAFALSAGAAAAVDIETVTVGDAGNEADTRFETPGYGAVGYKYNIGKYEVTAGQYCEFLNAVAGDDTYGLYNSYMEYAPQPDFQGCNIVRHGVPGGYSYTVSTAWAGRPVNFVSWGDAVRFCNWLHNGQPWGAQDASTTEDGAYFVNGATGFWQLMAVTRKPGWKWAIPSEDEWYKAAYYKGGSTHAGYWSYPTGSDSPPSNVLGSPTDPGNSATYFVNALPYYTIGSPYWRTPVGAHENSDGPYGTFDQAGNVHEWNDSVVDVEGIGGCDGRCRGMRGWCYIANYTHLHASARDWSDPTWATYSSGFRVVECASLHVRTDLTDDGDVDGEDFGVFASCFNGTGNVVSGGCLASDLNGDQYVDGADYGLFAMCFNGTGNPPAC